MRYFHRLFLLLLLLPLWCSGVPITQKKINKKDYCHLIELFRGNRFYTAAGNGKLRAVKRKQSCIFTEKQRRITLNDVKVELLDLPVYEKQIPWLSVLDWYKTLRPLLYPATVSRKKIHTIMIDMGHGGNDPGAIGKISQEKMITLNIGRKLAGILRQYGFKVVMTRNSDIHLPLNKIGQMQQKSGSDLFVSIHVNSAKDTSITGIETFCLTPRGAASSNGGKVSTATHPGNRQDAANILLAWNIQNSLLKQTRAVDRGVKRARFAVLKDLSAPGVLVEVGFISNRNEERNLNQQEYINKIAAGIANGIAAFCRTTRPKQ